MLDTGRRPGAKPGGFDAAFARVDVEATPDARAALARLGRTEDIRFSPDNRRLAVAAFFSDAIHVFDIGDGSFLPAASVRLTGAVELRSQALRHPHGVDFLDNDTLVVANRGGAVSVLPIPATAGQAIATVAPKRIFARANLLHRVRSPGSVVVLGVRSGVADILVCNNYRHRITRHRFALSAPWTPAISAIALECGLAVPDGIAASPDRSWIAVSNHGTASVHLFDARAGLRRGSEAAGELVGVAWPHGLRFSPDGRRLYVADAGAPLVQVFHSDGDWRGRREPAEALRVLDDEAFFAGSASAEEGGPKGIDLDATGSILAATCEERPLAFFRLP